MRPFIFPGVGNQGNCAGCGYAFAAVDSVSISSAVVFGSAASSDPKKIGGYIVYNMYNMRYVHLLCIEEYLKKE